MRKALCLAALLLLAVSTRSFAWNISDYHVDMLVGQDSSVTVKETIVADFSGDPHHGIFRFIPLDTTDRFGNKYRVKLDVLGITNEAGVDLTTQTTTGYNKLHLKIGDADVLLDDVRTYVIRYRVLRAVRFFPEQDELYWNAIGSEWEVPIDRADCTVTLPPDVPAGKLRVLSYTGGYGATTTDSSARTPNARTAVFRTTRVLQPGEGMTIVVGWPHGIIQEPAAKQRVLWFMLDNGWAFLLPLFILGLIMLWARAGRDPDTGRSEVVAYDPPEGMSPAELGSLIDERADMRDISASIVDLAVRGYIHISTEMKEGWFSSLDYEFKLLKPNDQIKSDSSLNDFERRLIDAIFSSADTRRLSSLKNTFYAHIPKLQDALYRSMMSRRYFTNRPDSVRSGYQVGGWVVIVAGFLSLIFLGLVEDPPVRVPFGWSIATMLCGIALLIAARTMPRKTTKGKDALLATRGFEEYLSRAEAGLIKHQEREGYFEKYLPYAMAFGIADRWASAFEGLNVKPPDWYSGRGGDFRPTIFASDMSHASSSWGSAMASTPRSSGSGGSAGGSGFSGGSSGGGGGGGGGGGW